MLVTICLSFYYHDSNSKALIETTERNIEALNTATQKQIITQQAEFLLKDLRLLHLAYADIVFNEAVIKNRLEGHKKINDKQVIITEFSLLGIETFLKNLPSNKKELIEVMVELRHIFANWNLTIRSIVTGTESTSIKKNTSHLIREMQNQQYTNKIKEAKEMLTKIIREYESAYEKSYEN